MKADIIIATIIITALCWATYVTIVKVSEPRIVKPTPCRTEFGHDRPQEFCDAWK